VELDKSYFDGIRKDKRDRGAVGKAYTRVARDIKTETLMSLITRKIVSDCIVYTNCCSYNALDMNHFYHEWINHSTLFAQDKNHINGIENFWNHAQRVLRKYNSISKGSFPLFLKECEFRCSHALPQQQLKILKSWIQI